MDIFPLLGRAIRGLPFERVLFPTRNPQEELKKFIEAERVVSPEKPLEESESVAVSPPAISEPVLPAPATQDLPTSEETTQELKRRLAKELYRAQLDLANGLRIAGKPCDCLDGKHALMLEAAAEELIPNEPENGIYREIVGWLKGNLHKVTIEAISSGQYDQEYPVMAGEFRDFRKRVMGTTSLSAMTGSKA